MDTNYIDIMINETDKNIIQQMAKDSEDNATYEFEAVLDVKHQSWSREDFKRVFDLCRNESCKSGGFKCIKERDKTLDISIGEYRVTINGKYFIELYIQNKENLNTLPKDCFSIIKKERVRAHNSQRGYRLNLKNEIPVDIDDPEFATALVEWDRLAKTFRMKNRYSYLVNNLYSVDLTIVKSTLNGSQIIRTRTLLESRTLEAKEIYEIEVEYLPNETSKFEIEYWSKLIYRLVCTLQNCWKLVDDETLENIKNQYYLTLDPQARQIENVKKKSIDWVFQKFGLSPQVVTLDMEKLRELKEMNDNEYTITMKSDGVRMIGYISLNSGGNAELFLAGSSSTKFIATGLLFDNQTVGTIFDGELITKDKAGNTIADYLIFDCYYFMGNDIRKNNLLTGQFTRLSKAQEIVNDLTEIEMLNNGIRMKCVVKEFSSLTVNDFKNKCKEWLQKVDESPYENDGLIFTPEEAVGGKDIYPENSTVFVKSSGTFARLLKWKDISFNSIDFKVNVGETVKKLDENDVLVTYNKCVLNVAYSNSWKPTTQFTRDDYLKSDSSYDVKEDKSSILEFMPYSPPDQTACFVDLPQTDDVLRCKTETGWDGESFKNGDIVEMVYYLNGTIKWIPIRVRRDKGGRPNHFNTASNIWRSYFNPVTKEILTGEDEIPDKNLDDDIYYNLINVSNRSQTRRESALRLFHCHIKGLLMEQVFKDFDKDNRTLIDLCSGKGGDLNRYMEFGASKVIGIDNSVDNLHNPIDGAYRRLWKLNLSNKNRIKFLAADVGNNLTLSKTFYSPYDKSPELTIFKGNPQFNACTVFFALHYFFENKTRVSTFLDNVTANVKKGGYFAGCCYDGSNIFEKLMNKDFINFKVQNREILRIEKQYKETEQFKSDYSCLGHKIRVLVQSIGTEHDEYLVNFLFLKYELEKIGFVEVNLKSFESYYQDITNNRFKMEEEEQLASFLNRTFVFRKENNYSGESKIVKDKLKL